MRRPARQAAKPSTMRRRASPHPVTESNPESLRVVAPSCLVGGRRALTETVEAYVLLCIRRPVLRTSLVLATITLSPSLSDSQRPPGSVIGLCIHELERRFRTVVSCVAMPRFESLASTIRPERYLRRGVKTMRILDS